MPGQAVRVRRRGVSRPDVHGHGGLRQPGGRSGDAHVRGRSDRRQRRPAAQAGLLRQGRRADAQSTSACWRCPKKRSRRWPASRRFTSSRTARRASSRSPSAPARTSWSKSSTGLKGDETAGHDQPQSAGHRRDAVAGAGAGRRAGAAARQGAGHEPCRSQRQAARLRRS